MTLKARLALATASAVALAVMLLFGVVLHAEHRELRLLVDADLRERAAELAGALLGPGEVDPLLRPLPVHRSSIYAQVVRADGEVVPLSGPAAALPVGPATRAVAAGEGERFYETLVLDGTSVRVLTVPLREGALQVARSTEELERHLLDFRAVLVLSGLGGVSLAVILGLLVAKTALRPVNRLTAAAERLATARQLGGRLEVAGNDELARLAASINTMLAALEASVASRRQLVADASHELRTPLTSLRTNLEVLERAAALPEEERGRVLGDVRAEVEGLIAAVDDLLGLARDRVPESEWEDIALDELVCESVAWCRRRQPAARIECRLGRVVRPADRAQVQRAIGNLLDNALKWGPPEGPVEVDLHAGGLTVRDHGPGIDPADLTRVFERFYRAPGARGHPGAGLGLAIVQKVAEDHGWTVTAENAEGGGARLRVVFPGQVDDSAGNLMSVSSSIQDSRVQTGETAQMP